MKRLKAATVFIWDIWKRKKIEKKIVKKKEEKKVENQNIF